MRQFKVKVIAFQLKNQKIAKSPDIVSEDQLAGNADDLVNKGFLEEVAAEAPVTEKGKSKGTTKKSDVEKIEELKGKLATAREARLALPDTSLPGVINAADKKVEKLIEDLVKLGLKAEDLLPPAAPVTGATDANGKLLDGSGGDAEDENQDDDDNELSEEAKAEIEKLLPDYQEAVKVHAELPEDATPKQIGAAAAAVNALETQLKDLGYSFPVKEEE